MARLQRLPLALPLRGYALAGLCAIYLLAGLIGHDPWKNDDAIHFGVVYGFLNSHDWLVPRLAGEVFLETPPLYYWIAGICAHLFGWLLPLHDAVRLASGLFGAIFLGLLGFASHTLTELDAASVNSRQPAESRETGGVAILIAIGCLGLMVPIHDTQPAIALLAASAATYAGLAKVFERPLAGGLTAGVGLGLGFLASGLIAICLLAPVMVLLPLGRHWRHAASLRGIAVAALTALAICAIWPLLLFRESPELFRQWWALATGAIRYQGDWINTLADHAELLAWFAWPALPLALWALWLNRRSLTHPATMLPLAGTAVALGCSLLILGPRPLLALPVLVPLILLATSGANRLRRGANNAFDWFGMMTFTLIAGLIWLGGIAMTTGIPAQIAHNFSKLEPGFVARFSLPMYTAAGILSFAWFWLIFASPRSQWRSTIHWAAGTTLIWVLLTTLWMPWIDYGKSYRSVAASLKQAIVQARGSGQCIAGRRLGGAQRVSLQYFEGIVTLQHENRAARDCPLLLDQGSERGDHAPSGWRKVWEGHRPGDRSERLRLYRRES